MPWDLPIAVLTGFENPVTGWVISTNQTDLNLYDYTGNQPEIQEYNVLVEAGVDINTMALGNFPAGCIINFTLLGRIRGRGGWGAEGAWAQGEPETGGNGLGWATGPGAGPGAGENALVLAPAVTFRLDLDSGYIWGGGGGGGFGGSIVDQAGIAAAGGGGGGGRGWNISAGGEGGEASGYNSSHGNNGADGTASGTGAGGAGGASSGTFGTRGGNGGDWGSGGEKVSFGPSTTNADGAHSSTSTGNGGVPGKAIDLNGVTLQFVGAKGEATLISEGRLRGPVS